MVKIKTFEVSTILAQQMQKMSRELLLSKATVNSPQLDGGKSLICRRGWRGRQAAGSRSSVIEMGTAAVKRLPVTSVPTMPPLPPMCDPLIVVRSSNPGRIWSRKCLCRFFVESTQIFLRRGARLYGDSCLVYKFLFLNSYKARLSMLYTLSASFNSNKNFYNMCRDCCKCVWRYITSQRRGNLVQY